MMNKKIAKLSVKQTTSLPFWVRGQNLLANSDQLVEIFLFKKWNFFFTYFEIETFLYGNTKIFHFDIF